MQKNRCIRDFCTYTAKGLDFDVASGRMMATGIAGKLFH